VVSGGERHVAFRNERLGDRDLVRRLATIPIHPAHVWRDGAEAGLVGSGPYRLARASAPRRLVLERVPDYWARAHGVNRGRFNFDRIEIDFYRDDTVALEAFRADAFDVRFEDDPSRWRSAYAGPAFDSGAIRRVAQEGPHAGTLHGLVFNLRRAPLDDRRVRLALTLAYDFEAVNERLFAGGYQRFSSVFGETELAASGPAGAAERAILRGAGDLPEGALDGPDPLAGLAQPGSRDALRTASRLLDEAGLPLDGDVRVEASGEPVVLEIVSPAPNLDRPLAWLASAARRLGVELRVVQADPTTASRRMLDKTFDLAALSWSPAPLPGTAERLLWHSELAGMDGSYALSGIRSEALDAAIEALERARSPEALRAAARAFDRTFRHTLVMLPLLRSNTTRLAFWDRFGRPEGHGLPPAPLDRWWANG